MLISTFLIIVLALAIIFTSVVLCIALYSILTCPSKRAMIPLLIIWIGAAIFFAHIVWFKVFLAISILGDLS
jgi:hypothetical protein